MSERRGDREKIEGVWGGGEEQKKKIGRAYWRGAAVGGDGRTARPRRAQRALLLLPPPRG